MTLLRASKSSYVVVIFAILTVTVIERLHSEKNGTLTTSIALFGRPKIKYNIV